MSSVVSPRKEFQEVVVAEWLKMVEEGTRWEITDMTTGTEAPEELKARLNLPHRDAPTDMVRRAMLNWSRRGGIAKQKTRKRTSREERVFKAAKLHRKEKAREHSQQYVELLASPQWQDFCRSLKLAKDYRCDGCSRIRLGHDLEVHHIHYDDLTVLRTEDFLLLCKDPCHPLLDMLRDWGANCDDDTDRPDWLNFAG